VVRRFVGYDRYEGTAALRKLEGLYQVLRLYVNFFQPVQKLAAKERIGSKVKKRYDVAKTPYQRVLEAEHLPAAGRGQRREQAVAA